MDAAYENWARSAGEYFQKAMGLASGFSVPCARLYIALWARGLNPRISRGWSDPAHQAELRARWDRGDRAGLRVRPAEKSQHTATSFLGNPAATAIDMPCNDDMAAAKIASSLGIGAGLNYTTPDPGHYYMLGA